MSENYDVSREAAISSVGNVTFCTAVQDTKNKISNRISKSVRDREFWTKQTQGLDSDLVAAAVIREINRIELLCTALL